MKEIITRLRDSGIHISVVNGNLRVEPIEKLTPELVEAIKANKRGIAKYLNGGGEQNKRVQGICENDESYSCLKPYINEYGELIIPFGADARYHYWGGGMNILDILLELNASEEVVCKYVVERG